MSKDEQQTFIFLNILVDGQSKRSWAIPKGRRHGLDGKARGKNINQFHKILKNAEVAFHIKTNFTSQYIDLSNTITLYYCCVQSILMLLMFNDLCKQLIV
jgi:hypothetical protein